MPYFADEGRERDRVRNLRHRKTSITRPTTSHRGRPMRARSRSYSAERNCCQRRRRSRSYERRHSDTRHKLTTATVTKQRRRRSRSRSRSRSRTPRIITVPVPVPAADYPYAYVRRMLNLSSELSCYRLTNCFSCRLGHRRRSVHNLIPCMAPCHTVCHRALCILRILILLLTHDRG